MNVKERGWGSMDLVPFPQDKEKWRGGGSSEHGDELSPFIKFEYIFFFTI